MERVYFNSTTWTCIRDGASGDKKAIGQLYEIYLPPVRNYLQQRGIAETESEDLAQEVFVRVCSQDFLKAADPAKGKFRTLLLRVTQHVMIDYLRRRTGKSNVSIDELKARYSTIHIEAPSDEPRDGEFDRCWADNLLRLAFKRLKEESKEFYDVLMAHVARHEKYEAIAERFGKKLQDVKNIIHRSKGKLRRYVEELISDYAIDPEEARGEAKELAGLLPWE